MTGVLIGVVLVGTALVILGGRLVVKRWNTPGNNVVPGGTGGLLALAGALIVILATPPLMDHLFPEEGSLASSPTGPGTPPTPSHTMDMGSPSPSPAVSSEASPAPTEPSSPTPSTAAPATKAASPSPPTRARRTTTRTSTGSAGTAPAPQVPAAPAASPSPEPTASVVPSPSPSTPEQPLPEPSIVPSPSPPPSSPPVTPAFAVRVTCSGLDDTMKRGDHFTMTYEIDATTPRSVGLGAALLDPEGDDHSNGAGDRDSFAVPAGHATVSRSVDVPSNLRSRTFEVVGQVWPENHVGDGKAQVIAQDACGSFAVTG